MKILKKVPNIAVVFAEALQAIGHRKAATPVSRGALRGDESWLPGREARTVFGISLVLLCYVTVDCISDSETHMTEAGCTEDIHHRRKPGRKDKTRSGPGVWPGSRL
jgi:hypothetical protein